MKIKTWIGAGAAAVALAGCGGGGGDNSPTSQVPLTAMQSIDGYISYLKSLVAVQDDTLSPVDVSGLTPPTDETSSPAAVD